jgi:hypothetical protein
MNKRFERSLPSAQSNEEGLVSDNESIDRTSEARRVIDLLAAHAGLSDDQHFDEDAYEKAMAEVPELTDNLLKVMSGEMSPEEAKRRAEELFERVRDRYRALAQENLEKK